VLRLSLLLSHPPLSSEGGEVFENGLTLRGVRPFSFSTDREKAAMNEKHSSIEALDTDVGKKLRSSLEQIKLIATGGMSFIFRAFQPSLGRYLVVKRLKDELLQNPETLERFRREARALASVLHQNIAHVYDYVEAPGEAFILMEHIEGLDLSTVIEKLGSLPPDFAAAVILGVARGLAHIHANELIHRDIKPSNIRISTHGGVKLMDFGIVLELGNTTLTRPGMMVGSPSYLSPEQVLGDVITPQSDLFLLGITFYEMLTGSRPFKAEGGNTVFQSIREVSFVPARKMNSKVPRELDHIVSRCLKQDPASRFGGARGLIVALESYLGPEISSRPEEGILKFLDDEALLKAATPIAAPLRPHRSRAIRWTVAGALFLALVGASYLWGHRTGRKYQASQQRAVDILEAKAKAPKRK
jgi:eukaryotic-like serine/threonine-protein kinase